MESLGSQSVSKKDAQLIGIHKRKQKASSMEPQEKEIFKNTRSCPIKQYESCYPKRSPDWEL